jgi:hypothetical protein
MRTQAAKRDAPYDWSVPRNDAMRPLNYSLGWGDDGDGVMTGMTLKGCSAQNSINKYSRISLSGMFFKAGF